MIRSGFADRPTDNQPQVTEILKNLLKHDYNYDSTVSDPLLIPCRMRGSYLAERRIHSERFIAPSHNVVLLKTMAISYSIKISSERAKESLLRMRRIPEP